MIFDRQKSIHANLLHSINQLTNMYVDWDIVKLSFVGNSQIPIVGF